MEHLIKCATKRELCKDDPSIQLTLAAKCAPDHQALP